MIRGHGWITPRPDGAKARCGGPGLCSHCQLEQRVKVLETEIDACRCGHSPACSLWKGRHQVAWKS